MAVLKPTEIFPAHVEGLTTRMVQLSTGVRLRVAEGGPAGGVPLLMLHGWASSMYMFRHAFALLPELGIRPMAVDLRGHGLSDHPKSKGAYSLEAQLADLEALLDALGLDRVALMGQSMGGGIALHYSLRMPSRVTRLVVVNPVGLVPIGWVSLMRLTRPAVADAIGERILIPRWLAQLVLRELAFGDARRVTEVDVDENWATTQVPGFAFATTAALAEFDWKPLSVEASSALVVPTLAVVGTKDRVIRHSRSAAERLRGARVVSFEGGHCVHEEYPAEIYRLVGDHVIGGSTM